MAEVAPVKSHPHHLKWGKNHHHHHHRVPKPYDVVHHHHLLSSRRDQEPSRFESNGVQNKSGSGIGPRPRRYLAKANNKDSGTSQMRNGEMDRKRDIQPKSLPLSAAAACLHPMMVKGGFCSACRTYVPEESKPPTIPLRYICEGLEVSILEMIRLRASFHDTLLAEKKLCLILDLDHTLLHTVNRLKPDERYLLDLVDSDGRPHDLFRAEKCLIKLRPRVHDFLQHADQMFDMYKVIAKEDMRDKSKKSLDVLPFPENVVVIFDDTEAVWKDHIDNLIVARKYYYFAGRDGPSPSFAELEEDESDSVLLSLLLKLERLHHMFFEKNPHIDPYKRDVREMLKTLNKRLLGSECIILYFYGE